MTNQDHETEASQNVVVPMDTIEKIADAQAFELWGENIGRGAPIPLYDTSGLYAYVVPYIRGAKQFPPDKTLFRRLRALRKDFEVRAGVRSYACILLFCAAPDGRRLRLCLRLG